MSWHAGLREEIDGMFASLSNVPTYECLGFLGPNSHVLTRGRDVLCVHIRTRRKGRDMAARRRSNRAWRERNRVYDLQRKRVQRTRGRL
jgi:hypothetical protein